ncbi:MAG: thiol-disulfide oxidoreductase DCC family protein [Paludibacter sp.]|nr:thiol-disulfide oxidoreductase DCC family protein [Paludibacter sp.]
MNEYPVILFDGICNLCSAWVQFLIRRDKKSIFKFASIQSDTGQQLIDSVGESKVTQNTIVYLKDNQMFVESAAVLEILKDLGGIWQVFAVFQLIPKSIRDGVYRFIAKRRYSIFGKRAACLLPSPENQKRFLT